MSLPRQDHKAPFANGLIRLFSSALSIAVLLLLQSALAQAEGERPPFLTLEDQRRCIVQDDGCFAWIYQKSLIAPIVRQVLLKRGFEKKSAFFIARDWDAFRYDMETGEKLLPKPPMLVSGDDAVAFASLIPQCLKNIASSNCQIRFALEYGCNLQSDYMQACHTSFKSFRLKFPRVHSSGKQFMSWYGPEYDFYTALACLYGPNGGDIPVFDSGPAAAVTKLKFEASSEAAKLAGRQLPPPGSATAPPTRAAAPMCKAVVRASHWRGHEPFHEGQELPVGLEVSSVDINDGRLVLRRRGDELPETLSGTATTAVNVPLMDYKDLREGWLGMELGAVEDGPQLGAPLPRAVITYVVPSGAAAQAGLRAGDRILRLGGRSIDDAMYLGLHATEAPIGEPMEVVYQRDAAMAVATIVAMDLDQAAAANDRLALRYIGDFHAARAIGEAPDGHPALRSYAKAAALGDIKAMGRLGALFSSGGESSTLSQALVWFEKGARAGHVPSMGRLAAMLARGEGGPKNIPAAHRWLEEGAAGGALDQMYDIVLLYRAEGAAKLAEQRSWLQKIVDVPKDAIPKDGGRFIDQASFDLAVSKLHGLGGPKDLADGKRLLAHVAESGRVAEAPYLYGLFLMSAEGGQDYASAKRWFERGAKSENADPNAMWALGMMYKDGLGGAPRLAEAYKWLKMAAERGHKSAPNDLKGLPIPRKDKNHGHKTTPAP